MISKDQINLSFICCCKCKRKFNNSKRKPFILRCFHIICSECIKHLKLKYYLHCLKLNNFNQSYNSNRLAHHQADHSRLELRIAKLDKHLRYKHLDRQIELILNRLESLSNESSSGDSVDDVLNRFVEYFRCSLCNRKYSDLNLFACQNRLILLPCWHFGCLDCHKRLSKQNTRCELCSNLFFIRLPSSLVNELDNNEESNSRDSDDLDELNDERLEKLISILNQFKMSQQIKLLNYFDEFFERFDGRRCETIALVIKEHDKTIEVIEQKSIGLLEDVENEINANRNDLLKCVKSKFEQQLKAVSLDGFIYFKECPINFSFLNLIGSFSVKTNIMKRLNDLTFTHKYEKYLNLGDLSITPASSQYKWYELPANQNRIKEFMNLTPIAENILVLNNSWIYYGYQFDDRSYKMRIANHFDVNNKQFSQISSVYRLPKEKTKKFNGFKLEMCRYEPSFDYIVNLIELCYCERYVIEVYRYKIGYAKLRLINRIYTNNIVMSIVTNQNEIILWCPYDEEDLIKIYKYDDSTETHMSTDVKAKLKELGKFMICNHYFGFDDASDDLFIIHNQSNVLILDRKECKPLKSIKLDDSYPVLNESVYQRLNNKLIRSTSYLLLLNNKLNLSIFDLKSQEIVYRIQLSSVLSIQNRDNFFIIDQNKDNFRLALFDSLTTNLVII